MRPNCFNLGKNELMMQLLQQWLKDAGTINAFETSIFSANNIIRPFTTAQTGKAYSKLLILTFKSLTAEASNQQVRDGFHNNFFF